MIEQTTNTGKRRVTPLIVGVVVLSVVVALLSARRAAILADLGNWGGAMGAVIGPFIWYAVIQLLLTWAARRLFGHPGSRFTTSKLNYLTLVLVLALVLGSVARPIA